MIASVDSADGSNELDQLLGDQVAYYRAVAHEYGDCLKPGGRVFFVDDGYRTPDELVKGEASSTIRRRLNDGTSDRAVKVPHEPAELEQRLAEIGWSMNVAPTAGPFYWGSGRLA